MKTSKQTLTVTEIVEARNETDSEEKTEIIRIIIGHSFILYCVLIAKIFDENVISITIRIPPSVIVIFLQC